MSTPQALTLDIGGLAEYWKMLMVAETEFRRLNRPELLANVHHGAECQDGIEDYAREAAA